MPLSPAIRSHPEITSSRDIAKKVKEILTGFISYHSALKEKENEILPVTSVVSVNSDAVKSS